MSSSNYWIKIWVLAFLGLQLSMLHARTTASDVFAPIHLPKLLENKEQQFRLVSESRIDDFYALSGWYPLGTFGHVHSGVKSSGFSILKEYDLLSHLPQELEALNALAESRKGAYSLPLLLNDAPFAAQYDLGDHLLFLTDIEETALGMVCNLLYAVTTPENQILYFKGEQILFEGLDRGFCAMHLMMEEEVGINDPEFPITIKGSMDLDSASFVEFNCDGFDRFQLLCEYRFPSSILKPVLQGRQSVRALFRIVSVGLGDFIGSVTVDPFEIVGVDDVIFEIQEASVDFSTAENHPPMLSAVQDTWPELVKTRYNDVTWRGFFMKRLAISLPEGFGGTDGNRLTIAIEDLIADHGMGVSGRLVANPGLSGNVSGWGISLDSFLLEVVTNSVHSFRINGGLNIPIMEGTSNYLALFSFPQSGGSTHADISLTLSLDGIYTLPFLSNSNLELNSGSMAGIRYANSKFEPFAELHGSINISLQNPSISFPALVFESFKINDNTLAGVNTGSHQGPTGGLDKISIGAFGFGGFMLPGSGGSSGMSSPVGGGSGSQGSSSQGGGSGSGSSGSSSSGSGASGNQSLAGFPITIKNIGFGSAMDGNIPCYKLDFTIGVNFAAGVDAFSSEGSFAVWGEIDFAKIISSTPWRAVSYRKTTVESVWIEADFGKLSIAGGIRIINDDPVYGNGFKGAIKMDVKLPTAMFYVHCVGQFGNIPTSIHDPSYRYFFIDAEVGFSPGLQLGNTGLAIYGFSGGFFYNMERGGPPAEEVAAAKNVSNMPSNQAPALSDDLLAPGISLSGTQYIPKKDVMSFQVGMIFGLSAPQTLLADVAFGMEFNTGGGFAIQRIYFQGGAYIMNPGLANRSEGSVVVKVDLTLDLINNDLVGKFGMAVRVPFGVPESSAIVNGRYNMDLSEVNIYFRFKGQREYFFYAGTPTSPMKIDFQLSSSIRLASMNAYFMAGTQMPSIPTLNEVFASEGFTLPSQFQSSANRRFIGGEQGIAFGARLSIPNRSYSFLMFSARLRAFAGFDASLMRLSGTPSCGSNGTFGMNNWYMQGQAYGAFYGRLDMDIDVFFYKGRVKIAELEAGVALQAQLPNPTWLMGFIYGRYSVLGGRIKGSFNFKMEMGERCSDLPEFNPVASIPLIQDVKPESNSVAEVYESPIATFFVPMGQQFSFAVPLEDGTEEMRTYQCFIDESRCRLTKRGSNVTIPFDIEYRDTFMTAVFQQRNLLEPNTEYTFRIRASWHEWRGNVQVSNPAFEEKVINFRTGDLPNRIVTEAVGYHAPGRGQRYWHKNYARPMLEFKQEGWGFLFPSSKTVSLFVPEQEVADAFQQVGWTVTPETRRVTRLVLERIRVGNIWMSFPRIVSIDEPTGRQAISRNIDVKYILRLRNLNNQEITNVNINGHPGATASFQNAFIDQRGFADGFSNLFRVNFVNNQSSEGRQVLFDGLNSLNLAKGHIYSAQILRVPVESVPIPSLTAMIENNSQLIWNDTLELYSMSVSSVGITPMDNFRQQLREAIGEDVLYNNYHFAISQYNDLNDKIADLTNPGWMIGGGNLRRDFGHPESRILQIQWHFATNDNYYGFTNGTEPFDLYDEIKIRTNLDVRNDGTFTNALRADIYYNRRAVHHIDLMDYTIRWMGRVTTTHEQATYNLRRNHHVNRLEIIVQRKEVPYDLYYPFSQTANRRLTDQSGVQVVNANNRPSFWFDIGGRRLNANQDANRVAYQHYQNFVNTITQDYRDLAGWGFQFHFNTGFPNLLSQTEINSGRLRDWAGGNRGSNYAVPGRFIFAPASAVMWIQDSEARIQRNLIQLFLYHGQFLEYIVRYSGHNMTLCPTHASVLSVFRRFYTQDMWDVRSGNNITIYNDSWPRVWTHTYNRNRTQMEAYSLGFRYRRSTTVPPYMHTRGNILGHNLTMPVVLGPYRLQVN